MELTITFKPTGPTKYLVELTLPEGDPCPSPGINAYLLINQWLQRHNHGYEVIPTGDFQKKFRFEVKTPTEDAEKYQRDIMQAIEEITGVTVLTS